MAFILPSMVLIEEKEKKRAIAKYDRTRKEFSFVKGARILFTTRNWFEGVFWNADTKVSFRLRSGGGASIASKKENVKKKRKKYPGGNGNTRLPIEFSRNDISIPFVSENTKRNVRFSRLGVAAAVKIEEEKGLEASDQTRKVLLDQAGRSRGLRGFPERRLKSCKRVYSKRVRRCSLARSAGYPAHIVGARRRV